jgi:hypothetical protein
MANPPTATPTTATPTAPTKPKRERKPKAPPTLIGTLAAVNKLLTPHTGEERAKILAFVSENAK